MATIADALSGVLSGLATLIDVVVVVSSVRSNTVSVAVVVSSSMSEATGGDGGGEVEADASLMGIAEAGGARPARAAAVLAAGTLDTKIPASWALINSQRSMIPSPLASIIRRTRGTSASFIVH